MPHLDIDNAQIVVCVGIFGRQTNRLFQRVFCAGVGLRIGKGNAQRQIGDRKIGLETDRRLQRRNSSLVIALKMV